jgi:microcystin degradation protein MlrC
VQTGRVYFVTPKDPAFVTWDVPGLAPVDTDDFDVVVVKNGYLFPGQAALATSAFMAITPGGTDLDFGRLRFDRWSRPMFPLDRDFAPDLTPVVL